MKDNFNPMTTAEREQFTLVEDAVKTGIAPAEIAAAFNELTMVKPAK